MNKKKEKLFWLCYAAVLVFLFLASSTDLIIKERKSQIYPISVIVEDSTDDHYVNFRKGMELAAEELHVDVSFITLYDKNDVSQQMELISREQQDGARALILSPIEEKKLSMAIADKRVTVPLVLLNSDLAGDTIASAITPDYYEMGNMLAEKIAESHDKSVPVYLFGEKKRNDMTIRFEQGVRSGLNQEGFSVVLVEKQTGDEYRQVIEELVYPGGGHALIVALEQESLLDTTEILSDSSVYASFVDGVYGRGSNLKILNGLDRGLIQGICVIDDFSAGYQSVKRAVEVITEGNAKEQQTKLEYFYIEKEDLRKKDFEKMLYPVE